jgi:UDP-3-O-[3-hydroxymyristoyl] glucosamine N-acyltransferase
MNFQYINLEKFMKKQIPVQEIINLLGTEVIQVLGNIEKRYIHHLKPVESVDEYTLDWVNSTRDNKQSIAESSKASVLLVDEEISFSENIQVQNKILIQVKSPRLGITMVAQGFFVAKQEAGIHPNATIHPEAVVSLTATISAGCVVGNCIIGDNTIVQPNVTIYDKVTIGKNCLIQAGVVIGTDGLGCQRLEDGTLVKFPHLGGVEIGDNVEIGANSQIARGALSNTIIKNGVKMNGLCFIAHNCILEENVWITGNTMLAGSVRVKKNTTIFSSVIIREQRTIGSGVIIGMGAVITKDVPDGETWFGNPAQKKEQ